MRSNGWSLAVSIFRTFYIFRPLHEICPEPQAGDSLLREAIRDGIFDPLRHESLDYVLARSRTSHYISCCDVFDASVEDHKFVATNTTTACC